MGCFRVFDGAEGGIVLTSGRGGGVESECLNGWRTRRLLDGSLATPSIVPLRPFHWTYPLHHSITILPSTPTSSSPQKLLSAQNLSPCWGNENACMSLACSSKAYEHRKTCSEA